MYQKQKFNISELSLSEHNFKKYHFCRGNGNKRKSRFGLIEKGNGTYMYLNRKIKVKEGDIVFIPERIFCYSEWKGEPDIKVTYISCFMKFDTNFYEYEPQILKQDKDTWKNMKKIEQLLLSENGLDELEAYSLFYKMLKFFVQYMKQSEICTDKTLQKAIEYITVNWNDNFSVAKVAKECCISESKLYHIFKEHLGQTPITFLNSIKINHAIQYLENEDYSVSEICRRVNFNSENHFRQVFQSITGTTPLKYKKNNIFLDLSNNI